MTPEARTQLQETYYPGYTHDGDGQHQMTLDSLADPPPGTKPRYPYSTLIRSVVVDFILFREVLTTWLTVF